MKIESNPRELYLTLIALNDKLTQLNTLPAPIGDQERNEYAQLTQTYSEALEKAHKGGDKHE